MTAEAFQVAEFVRIQSDVSRLPLHRIANPGSHPFDEWAALPHPAADAGRLALFCNAFGVLNGGRNRVNCSTWSIANPSTLRYPAPQSVHQAAADAAMTLPQVDEYVLVRGIDELLVEVDAKVTSENGIDTAKQRSVVTAGSNMGFMNAVQAIADVDDEVILPGPFYFNHEMAIEIAGCKPVIVDTDDDYQIDFAKLTAAISPRTRAIVTVSPGNPTGTVFSRESLIAVNQLCKERGIFHISDEAYEYFVYGSEAHFSPGSLPDSAGHTISLFTMSKAYGMAGWRIGYMTIPNALEVAVKKIQDTNLVCAPVINQIAATAAMKAGREWCDSQIAGFAKVRDLVLNELATLGDRCRVPTPDGAFYALITLDTAKSDLEVAESLVRDFGIALLPGSTFGVTDRCSLRIAYGALDADAVAEGMGRLKRGLKSIVA